LLRGSACAVCRITQAAVALAWDRIEKFFSTYLKDVTLERY